MSNRFFSTWPDWARKVAKMVGLGLIGGVFGYGVGWLLTAKIFPGAPSPSDLNLRWSDVLAGLVAFGLVFGAASVLIASLDARRMGQMYGLEGAASPSEIAQARLQAFVMGFSGFILVLPVVFSLTGGSPVLGVGIIGLLLVLHTLMNFKVYRQADELLRRAVLETATATFFLGQGLLFAWAVAERLGVAPPITAWYIYAVLMTLYLAVSVTVSVRRGLA
jgi:hypothetical protein